MGKSEKEEKPKKSWAKVGSSGGFGDRKRWNEDLNIFDFRQHAGEHICVRIVDFPYPVFQHWCHVKPEDAVRFKEGSIGKNEKISRYSFVCPDYDPETEVSSGETCPHCRELQGYNRPETLYYVNAFVKLPPKKKGREAEWSEDLYVLELKTSCIIGIRGLQTLKGHDPEDPKEGFSIAIRYNDKAKTPSDYWQVNFDEFMPLTKNQKLIVKEQLIDFGSVVIAGDSEQERVSLERKNFFEACGVDSEDDDGVSKKKKAKKSKLARDDEDDDDDEKPSKKSSKKKSSRDDDEDEDDEDEKPSKKSSRRNRDDDEDEDDDDDDDEDEDDEKPSKKKRRPLDDDDDEDDKPSKKKRRNRDDDEDEDDDDDDVSPKSKSKKSSRDDDDEDEDEKPSKKGKKKSSRDDDDDDDDIRPAKASKKASKKRR